MKRILYGHRKFEGDSVPLIEEFDEPTIHKAT